MDRKFIIVASYSDEESPAYTVIHLNNRNTLKKNFEYLETNFLPHDVKDHVQVSRHFVFGSYFASYFRCVLLNSRIFRRQVWYYLLGQTPANTVLVLRILLIQPIKYPLDYRFGIQIQMLVNERIELDHMMSCLSTLGGAFSSLGDQFLNCAKTAGNISLQQYKIAENLGDPVTLLRCQLYLSISLIQCNRLTNAKNVITSVHKSIKSMPEDLQDKRVISMCFGIWAKLKYHWHLERNRRKLKHEK